MTMNIESPVRFAGRARASIALALLALSRLSNAFATEPQTFNIEPQPLSQALVAFSEQSRLVVTASSALLTGKTAPAVVGRMTADEALQGLLAGSGLVFVRGAGGDLTVLKADRIPVGATGGDANEQIRLAQAESSNSRADQPDPVEEELEEVTVLARRNALDRIAEGGKMPVSLMKLPQAVTIIDSALLDDQNVVKLEDALRNAAGVNAGGYFEGFDFYRIRGFDASGFTLLDGLLADQTFWTQEELYGMQQVEVLKGPMSGLYGQSPAGGLVNLVSKRPMHQRLLKLQTSGGSNDYLDVGIDGNLPLNETMAIRLNGVFRKQGSYVDSVKVGERYFAAPAFSWSPSEDTQLTILTQFIEENTGLAQPLPAEGTVLPNPNGRIPFTRAIGEPGFDDTADIGRQQYGWEFWHRFNDTVRFKQVARGSTINVNFQAIYPWYLDEDLRTLNRYVRGQVVRASALAVDNQVIVTAGERWKHTLLAGLDWYKFNQHQGFAYDFDYPAIDVFDPQYGPAPAPQRVETLFPYQLKRTGLYVQDHLQLTERFSVLVGGRYDWTEEYVDWVDEETGGSVSNKKFSPRAGAVFEFTPHLSSYVSYATSFQPQGDQAPVIIEGQPVQALKPEIGEQIEFGIKTDLLEDRLTATLALYELTRNDVANEYGPTPEYDFITTGEQRSRGVEIDSIIRFTPTWELIANATYTKAVIRKDTVLAPGSRTLNVPKTFLNLWTKYTVPDGAMKGLGFSLGAISSGKQAGDDTYQGDEASAFDLPSYTAFDAGISYSKGPYVLSFDVDNLTDKLYFPSSYGRTFVMPAEPRTYRVGLEYTFR